MGVPAKEAAERFTSANNNLTRTTVDLVTLQGIDIQTISPNQQARLVIFPKSQEIIPKELAFFLTRAYGQKMELIGLGVSLTRNLNPSLNPYGDYLIGVDLLTSSQKKPTHPEFDGLTPDPKHGVWLCPVVEITPEVPPGRSWIEYFIQSEPMHLFPKTQNGGHKSGRIGAPVIESLTGFLNNVSIQNDQSTEPALGRTLRTSMGILVIIVNHTASSSPVVDQFELVKKQASQANRH